VGFPLSVAWFDAAGVLVGTSDLPVCNGDCPGVAPTLAYRAALEVPRGGLGHLGVSQGGALVSGGGCG
jgi:uncharacterized membrane protein (UPF0127 family)